MPDAVDASLVRHIAHLSRLALDDEELARMAGELSTLAAYFDQLQTLDTDGVPPAAHATGVENVLREDEVGTSYDAEKSLLNAPQTRDTFFCVPKVLDA